MIPLHGTTYIMIGVRFIVCFCIKQ